MIGTNGAKRLEDMPLEELWELFPIVLTEHRSVWKQWAADEIRFLQEVMAGLPCCLNHIGSTAVEGIWAKPIIDILLEAEAEVSFLEVRRRIEKAGYICMSVGNDRMSFNKGYTPTGFAEKVFHLHLHRAGDNGELYFRDYLIAHPEVAREYEALKLSLWKKYEHDRDGYTAAKTEFIMRYTPHFSAPNVLISSK